MHITFSELRQIKHQLPTGSIKTISDILGLSEQTIRNYFGAKKYKDGQIIGKHIQPGPQGGYVYLERSDILEAAKKLILIGETQAVA